jgi:hypothetical protein
MGKTVTFGVVVTLVRLVVPTLGAEVQEVIMEMGDPEL